MKSVPVDYIVWNWQNQVVRVGVDRLGVGPTVLLLPALSSISTRRETRLLQERLASNFSTVEPTGQASGTSHDRQSSGAPTPTVLFSATSSPRAYLDHSQQWLLGTRRAMPSRLVLLLRLPPGTPAFDRANMARPLANNDGRKTRVGRMDRPSLGICLWWASSSTG